MRISPRAITFDLDDTLWAIAPLIAAAEAALHAWLEEHTPGTARRYPLQAMRALRERVAGDSPHLAHDLTAQRRLALGMALQDSGDDLAHTDAAFAAFHAARNRVELYPDVADALDRLAARWPLAALTNGNADLALCGVDPHFRFCLNARDHGAAKPDPGIFRAACERLDCAPHEVLHVGDDPRCDVVGAAGAGLRTCWINRTGAAWTRPEVRPDLIVPDLAALADVLLAGDVNQGSAA
ncbi:HAD family hydrolase [Coralloluteibacterium stylophorae]|uniref:HAD-IA family hydrolase n=1 Tax=Coralloluteibacterium stylophorae TaxID=1776034 RepID=A0A8J8AWH5_9GAMM|nr:HAD-IA family hydrolase [Coralloluteibacterium stylophorae]MBS7458228.1 HAD-IA family hydrolase [Coralloluteibacterium stylophorae]